MASTKLILNGHHHHLERNNNNINHLSSLQTECNGVPKPNGIHQANNKTKNNNNNKNDNNNVQTNGTSSFATNSKSAQALIEVRRQFLEYAEQNPDKVNERDKQKLATDDWYLKRYLLARNRRVGDTMNMLKKTMDWRNEFGIHISEDAMFPLEFYKIGALFPYEHDKEGNLVMYMRIKYHQKIDEMVEVEKHFLVHTFEKIDRITNGQGLVIVFDCQGAGYANCDLEFLQFLIMCATEHSPIGLQYIIVYRLPWVLNAFWSIVRKILPAYLANRVRFCDEKSVRQYIEPDKLPDFMDGNCRRNYRWIPPGCPSVFKLAHAHGITDAEINKILPKFQALLDEAEEALDDASYEDPPESITTYVNNPETAPTLLSDLALCSIGLGSMSSENFNEQATTARGMQSTTNNELVVSSDTSAIIRLFPDEFVEFNYDAFNDVFHATVTIFNPSNTNSLAFKLMCNRPSNYSVKPSRGVLTPNAILTISIILLNDHRPVDKFLITAQPLEGEIKSISKAQFNSLWSQQTNTTTSFTHTTIKLGSYLRKIVTSPVIPTAIKNPQIYELVTTCRSLKRRQNLSIIINIVLLVIIINLLFSN